MMLSLMVDLMIVVCLIIMLRIARKRYNGWGGVSEDRAYVTALVGLLFYTLGICDCGTPSSIFTHLAYNGKKKGSDIRSGVPKASYQEIKEGPSEERRKLRLSEEEDNN
ncbi:hypothetical protein B0O99DRAFT_645675 [Bisporella sp. PMI_857]|nr:hypothetical protein B0O99DRAFT_645675 [Bisporella sp. PMI_857]